MKRQAEKYKKLFIFFIADVFKLHSSGSPLDPPCLPNPRQAREKKEMKTKEKLNKTAINDNFCVSPVPQILPLFFHNFYCKIDMKGLLVWGMGGGFEKEAGKYRFIYSDFNDNNRFPARSLF